MPPWAIASKLKELYYFFEDRYYDLLDKVNEHAPIYKLIEPIDRVFPSFVLFIALVCCLLLLFIFLALPQAVFSATILVVDESNSPVSGVSIDLMLDEETQSFSTDEFGEAALQIPSQELDAEASFSKEGFRTLIKNISLVAGETTTVTLAAEVAELGGEPFERTIMVVDGSTNQLLKKEVTITYRCAGGGPAPSTQSGSTGEFELIQAQNCISLIATASADGYERQSKTITKDITYITMNLVVIETTGTVRVTVGNDDGTPEADAAVGLIDETTNALVDSGSTSEAGGFSFAGVEPGTYTVSVTAVDGRTGQQTGILVRAGQTELVSITLPVLPPGKKILLQLVEQDTDNEIADATVLLYQGSVLIDSKVSDEHGLVEKYVSDENAAYLAVISHRDYITKVQPDLPLKEPADNTPTEISLVRSTPENSARLIVLVVDEDNVPIEDASVWLYDDSQPAIPINYPANKTNVDGNALFKNLAPGTYFARAKSGAAEGVSEKVTLAAGEEKATTVTVVIGEGTVEATVFDATIAEKEPLQGAEVEFVDAVHGEVLSTCTTGTNGKCESDAIKADRFVFVKASKEEFVSGVAAKVIDIVSGDRAKVEIGLIREADVQPIDFLDTRFLYFCSDWGCKSKPAKIESNPQGATAYYGRFELILSEDTDYANIVQHIRVGLDKDIHLPLDYGIKIDGVRAPASSSAVLSSCWNDNPAYPFEEPEGCSTSIDAKQANVYYDGFSEKIVLPVTVKFTIQGGLSDLTKLQFYYRAKADVAGEIKRTAEKIEVFQIGEVFCQDVGVAWSFKLHDLAEDSFANIPLDPEAAPVETKVNTEYGLSYWVYNCSGKEFSDVSLTAENKNPRAIAFNPFTEQDGDFGPESLLPAQTDFPNDTPLSDEFSIYPRMSTGGDASEMEFVLDAGTDVPGSTAIARLKVVPGRKMLVLYLPSSLPDVGTPPLSGAVVDAADQGTKIENAYVVLKVGAETYPADDGGKGIGWTDEDGVFSYANLPNLAGVTEVRLKVTKAGYEVKEVVIPVGHAPVIPDISYDCISFDTEELTVERSQATTADFRVQTNECGEGAVIRLETELSLYEDTKYLNEAQDAQFTLDKDESKKLKVKAAQNFLKIEPALGIGEYYIHLLARFKSDQGGFKGPLAKIRVFVEDETGCFTIDKTTFDISGGKDSGRITNKDECFAFVEDLLLPDLRKVHLHTDPKFVDFDVGIEELSPGVKRQRQQVYSDLQLDSGQSIELPVTTGGGFVNLDWVDVFMTDKEHSGHSKHNIFAHYFRGENDWQSITNLVPPIGADDEQIVGPVVDTEGWVDTETYYPPGLSTGLGAAASITDKPLWQGQHTLCNRNIPNAEASLAECALSGYFSGQFVVPYHFGGMANEIRLSLSGATANLSQIKWQYTSTDPDHEGKIDFDVINNGLAGETYALIQVEDSIEGSGIVLEDTDFDWTFTETGINDVPVDTNLLVAAEPQEIEPDKMLGISVSAANPRFGIYGLDLNNQAAVDGNLALLLSELGSEALGIEPLQTDTVLIDARTRSGGDSGGEILLLGYCSDGNWHYDGPHAINAADPIIRIDLPNTIPIEALALANIAMQSSDSNTAVVDDVTPRVYLAEETGPETSIGSYTIPAGQSQKSFKPTQKLKPEDFDRMRYTIATSTADVLISFDDTGIDITASPEASVVALTSTPGAAKKTGTEYFHVRLTGAEQKDCMGHGGITGRTGFIAKPNVLLNWEWDEIGINACDADNPNYIYCDPAQFSIEVVKKLERIRELASEGIVLNQQQINSLRWFDAYLIEDTFSSDFRSDFVDYYTKAVFGAPLQVLRDSGSYWDQYLLSTEKMHFQLDDGTGPAEIEAGKYEVFINLEFSGDQYDFFYDYLDEEGETVVELEAVITVIFRKLLPPAVYSPFYYLPFNGNIGVQSDGSYHREGYGLGFNNETEAIYLTGGWEGGSFVPVVATDSTSGARELSTEKVSDLASVNLTDRGMILDVSRDSAKGSILSLSFAPSFATAVLMSLLPDGGKAEAYYYLTEPVSGETIPSPVKAYMNFWTGAGSTMGIKPSRCVDYAGNPLPVVYQDSKAQGSQNCAILKEREDSYGYSYPVAQEGDQLYFESVFYIPFDDRINLHNACSNNSNFYSQSRDTATGANISLTEWSVSKNVGALQEVIDLVEAEYVCVTTEGESVKFWWNPQKLLSELDAQKQGIAAAQGLEWETHLKCLVSATG